MRRTWIGLLLVLVGVSACSGQSSAEMTLVSQRDTLATQMAFVHETATIGTDRLAMTVEYVETETDRVSVQGTRLAQTYVARGGVVGTIPFSTPLPSTSATSQAETSPEATTVSTPEPSAIPTEAPPALYNIVTSAGVGSNDCATGQVTSFTSSMEQIYVVATASNVVPGTELGARWFMEDQEVAHHTFVPDFPINQECIWFYIDQTDAPFTPGNWHVQLEVNGVPAATPVSFIITG
ncbi:MAG: hypothetical protein H6672_20765 [Anaerolineaceae bacterium]|nr:hypothetical protein [Anaerolineaceae bacterium]